MSNLNFLLRKAGKFTGIYEIKGKIYVHVTAHRNKFLLNKTKRRTIFQSYFRLKNEPLYVSGSPSSQHQEFVNCTFGTGICHTV